MRKRCLQKIDPLLLKCPLSSQCQPSVHPNTIENLQKVEMAKAILLQAELGTLSEPLFGKKSTGAAAYLYFNEK